MKLRTKGLIGLVVVLLIAASIIGVVLHKAEFQINNLVIEPREVLVGDSVVVSADIKNTGGRAGEYQATLTVNGDAQETRNLKVPAGSIQNVSFMVTPTSSGEYKVALGELTGIFVAKEGILPSLYEGDLWTYKVKKGGEESEVSYEVRGETAMEGEAVYVIDFTWKSPPDPFERGSIFLDKGTLYAVFEERSGTDESLPISQETTFTNRQLQGARWPLETGKEWSVSWEEKVTTKKGLLLTTEERYLFRTFKVEGMENVTTAAGDFRCFKVVERGEIGNVVGAYWYSDKIKREVRCEMVVEGVPVTYELASYEVSAIPPATPLPKIDIPSVTTYDEPTSGYIISYPEGWELATEEGAVYIFTSKSARGMYLASLKVQAVSIEDTPTLDEFQQEIMAATKETDPSFELVYITKVLAELPWYQLEWNSSQKEVKLKGKTIIAVKGQQIFLVTGRVQEAYLNDYWSALDRVIQSFGIRS
jgi:hypothetical protein